MGNQHSPKVGSTDLKTLFPTIAEQAHGWDPRGVSPGSNKKLDWKCNLGHTWGAVVAKRTKRGDGCPYCGNKRVLTGFNDLKTRNPYLAKEADGWDPSQIMPGNNKKFPWKCKLGHTWEATVNSRFSNGNSCPYCSNHKCWTGFNDLKTKFPDIAEEADDWDPTLILGGCNTKLPWKCKLGHKWAISPNKRTSRGDGCPYCGNKRVLTGFNDLQTRFPQIAKDADGWDPTKVMPGNTKRRQWKCSLGHTYLSAANWRTSQNSGCPYCSNNLVWSGFNDILTHYPKIAKTAHGWDPSTVLPRSGKKVKWICTCGHIYPMAPDQRIGQGQGCPHCAEGGYKRNKNAWFYLMERPGEQQFGITNDLKQRIAYHERYGWNQLDLVGPSSGELVYQTEVTLKKWLRKSVGCVPGKSENWATSSMEVRSLADLKEKSGVETELF